ncbi:MAG: hypothetical protein KC423_03035 [Anaerolineales bacterium]|nr:hypothetical protein [Anaerolineales bacterium]MCB9433127.1 hypothetical protein [Ardenticatenaceae bacterium]
MRVAEDLLPLVDKLNKREKLRLMQFLASNLALAEVSPHPDWPLHYFDQTFGALRHDPIERPEQDAFEVREEII